MSNRVISAKPNVAAAVAAGSAAFVVYGLTASLLGSMLPQLALHYRFTPRQGAQIAFLQALGLTMASLAAGPLMDRAGARLTLLGGTALMIAGLLGVTHAATPHAFGVALLCAGAGGGTIVTATNTLISDTGGNRRASLLAFTNTFFVVGGLLTPVLVARVFHGNAVAFCYLVAASAAASLSFSWALPRPQRNLDHRPHLIALLRVAPRRGRALVLLAVYVFLYVACEVGFWNWLPRDLMTRGVLQKTALDMLAFGFAFGMLMGRLIATPLLLRIRAATATLGGALLMSVAMWMALTATGHAAIWTAVFFSGVFMGPMFPSAIAMVGDSFPVMTGTFIGIVITAGWLGVAVSSLAIGALAGNNPAALGRALLLLPAFAVAMAGVAVALRLPRGQVAG
jgi:fucose permease